MTTVMRICTADPTDDSPNLSSKDVLAAIAAIVNFSFAFLIRFFIMQSLTFHIYFLDWKKGSREEEQACKGFSTIMLFKIILN